MELTLEQPATNGVFPYAVKTILLRPEFNRKVCRERWERPPRQNVQVEHWNVWHVGNVQTCLTFHPIYICRSLANRQLLSLTVNTFIYWIPNVMFNPVHHHCHPFTDFYKKFTCVEFKPFFIVRQIKQLYFFGKLVCWLFPLISTHVLIKHKDVTF